MEIIKINQNNNILPKEAVIDLVWTNCTATKALLAAIAEPNLFDEDMTTTTASILSQEVNPVDKQNATDAYDTLSTTLNKTNPSVMV